jgi:hypothetical protein
MKTMSRALSGSVGALVLSWSLVASAQQVPPAPEPSAPEPSVPEPAAPEPAPTTGWESAPAEPAPPSPAPPAYPPGYPPPYYPPAPRPRGYGVIGTAPSAPTRYRYEKQPNVALVATGAGLVGGFYVIDLIAVLIANFGNQTPWLAIPLAGPWITMAKRDWESCDEPDAPQEFCFRDEARGFMAFFLVLSGIGQAAGAVTFIAGFAAGHTEAVPVAIVPMSVPGGGGLSAVGHF